jgi:hypothetical protein
MRLRASSFISLTLVLWDCSVTGIIVTYNSKITNTLLEIYNSCPSMLIEVWSRVGMMILSHLLMSLCVWYMVISLGLHLIQKMHTPVIVQVYFAVKHPDLSQNTLFWTSLRIYHHAHLCSVFSSARNQIIPTFVKFCGVHQQNTKFSTVAMVAYSIL